MPESSVAQAPLSVSVIIPTYNMRETLARAVLSALTQTYPPARVIIVDDGSTDGSEELADLFGDAVIYVRQENAGVAAARNEGIARASTGLLAFLDADDYWLPTFLHAAVSFLATHPEAGGVGTAAYLRRPDSWQLYPRAAGTGELGTAVLSDFFHTYTRHHPLTASAVVIHRLVVDLVGPFRPDLRRAQDTEYWLRIATVAPWGFVARPLCVYEAVGPSLSRGSGAYARLPLITDWEREIVARLTPDQWPGYREYRRWRARRYFRPMLATGAIAGARDIARSGYREAPWPLSWIDRSLGLAPTPVWRALSLAWRAGAGVMRRVAG